MKVYIVAVSDCESHNVICVCSTKTIAERELFKQRDLLVEEWKHMDEVVNEWREKHCKEHQIEMAGDNMYLDMIEALSSDDYENWDNYPHDVITIDEIEVLDK